SAPPRKECKDEDYSVFVVESFATLTACARSNSIARIAQRLASSSSTSFRWESVALSASSLHRKPFWRPSCESMGIVRLPCASLSFRGGPLSDPWARVRHFHIAITNMHAERLRRPSNGRQRAQSDIVADACDEPRIGSRVMPSGAGHQEAFH